MTREQVVEEVKNYEKYPNGLSKECRDYIIKSLEQEPVIDKIREEIVDLGQRTMNDNRASGIWACRDIIDKYKSENEEWVNFADDLIPTIDKAESEE